MIPKYYIEVKVNGEVVCDGPLKIDEDENWQQYAQTIKQYEDAGYKHLYSSDGYIVLANFKERKSVFISYRLHLNIKDHNGNLIYDDSRLRKLNSISKYNSWHLACTQDSITLYEHIGYDRWGSSEYKSHKVESLDIFKDYEVILPKK